VVLALLLLSPGDLAAQGPVYTGSSIPVALWFIGAGVLGVAIAYGILRNRRRTRAHRQLTEAATRDVYREEERNRVSSGLD
jgi:hypothetical protein